MPDELTLEERQDLLDLARRSFEAAVNGRPLPLVHGQGLPERLLERGASFVTLTNRQGELRGCIGTLEAHQPLAQDVREHACAAALEDYRFPPVTPPEVADLLIEISRLSNPEPLLQHAGRTAVAAAPRGGWRDSARRAAPRHFPAAGVGKATRPGLFSVAPVPEDGHRPGRMAQAQFAGFYLPGGRISRSARTVLTG
ncbi:MAG: AmmeMemoRadiSam system protein A [Anaerolineae bacterium]|nr:AmmeMemoRadiSam system protein A [Anaerolineae bacterium]